MPVRPGFPRAWFGVFARSARPNTSPPIPQSPNTPLPVALRKALRKAIHASNILTAEMKALVAKP
jgi:hypothetical protein